MIRTIKKIECSGQAQPTVYEVGKYEGGYHIERLIVLRNEILKDLGIVNAAEVR